MPFQSEKQRRFLWAKHPEIAEAWAHGRSSVTGKKESASKRGKRKKKRGKKRSAPLKGKRGKKKTARRKASRKGKRRSRR